MREHLLDILFALVAGAFAIVGYGWPTMSPGPYEPRPRDPHGFRVMTWNVGGSKDSGRPLIDTQIDHVASVIRSLNPDLAMLQEIRDDAQVRRLLETLGKGWQVVTSHGPGRRLAVLCQRGQLTPWETGRTSRFMLATIYQSSHKQAIFVCNVHANAYSAKRRNRLLGQATMPLILLKNRAVGILAGDLNLDIDLDKRRDLFTDDEHLDVQTYNYIARHMTDAAAHAGSTAEPDRRLDYIFVSPNALGVVQAGPWKGHRIGDMYHDPVVADLIIRGNSRDLTERGQALDKNLEL